MQVPLTIQRKSNAGMAQLILNFYKPAPRLILDASYGKGTFWRGSIWANGSNTLLGDYNIVTLDRRPLPGVMLTADWNNLPFIKCFDLIFYDPPYGGIDWTPERFEAWRQKTGNMHPSNFSLTQDDECIDGKGELTVEAAKQFWLLLKRDGLLIYKHTHLQDYPENLFSIKDYLIQDLGTMPTWQKQTWARRNHAFWMILKKNVRGN